MILETNKNTIKIRALKYLHAGVSILLFAMFWYLYRYGFRIIEITKESRYDLFVPIIYAVFYIILCRTYKSYLLGYYRVSVLCRSQFLSQFFSLLFVWLMVTIAWWNLRQSPAIFLVLLLLQAVLDIVWTWFATKYFFKVTPPIKAAVLYINENDIHRLGRMNGEPIERLYKFDTRICCAGKTAKEIIPLIEDCSAIFVSGIDATTRNELAEYCIHNSKNGFFVPHVGDVLMSGAEYIQSFSSPVLNVHRYNPDIEFTFIKRLFDIISSALALLVLSPLMIIIAIAIKICDGGPVFYKQTRLTKDGKAFKIIKFRSMRPDAEKDGVARLAAENDSRITPIGRFIRKCRIDELPQLINILKGEMSVVGPRPERPEIFEQYCKEFPDFSMRLQAKAGLTGFAQVYGRYNTSPYEKLEFDLLYINQMNILTDIKIIFKTVGILFSAESTEGISEGKSTAI